MARNLRDKVIVITGASSGIGAATALACARAGMHVTVAARREEKLHALAAAIEKIGRRALPLACDVDSDDDVRRLFEQSWATFGRLDAAFANAGYGLCAAVLDTSDAQHRAIFETNYFGTVRTLRAATPDLRRTPDGLKHLLICSSAASEVGLPMFGAYAATKAAQDSIAGALRAELAHERIDVTSIHPVGTRTEFFDVAGRLGGRSLGDSTNTPSFMAQTPEQVARKIVAAIRRPRPEVWPRPSVRLGVAFATAFPRFVSFVMRREAAKFLRKHG